MFRATVVAGVACALSFAVASAGAATYNGPGTGTAYELQSGLAVIETPGNISPLDRTAPANLVTNGDMTDNGHANSTPYKWSPVTTNGLSGVQMISSVAAGSPPTTSMPGWTFSGGGTGTYSLWLPGTTAAVGPWSNGAANFGPFGSKNGASNPQLYFGNDEGWSISPAASSAGFTAQGVTQTTITWTPANASRNYMNGIAPTAAQTIATTAGSTYCLSYWVGHEWDHRIGVPYGIARLQIGGYNDVFFQVPPGLAAGERWYTFQFDATSSATPIAFTSWGHIGSGGSKTTELVLDDVVVNRCEARSSGGSSNTSGGGSTNANTANSSSAASASASGSRSTAAVGDIVWLDVNRNGVLDAGEKPLRGVKVTLLTPSGKRAKDAAGNVVPIETTTAGGRYVFDGLNPGRYRVRFLLPAGYRFTVSGKGTDATDSDSRATTSNPLSGVTPAFQLHAATKGNTVRNRNAKIDAGYIDPTLDAGVVPFAPTFTPSSVTG